MVGKIQKKNLQGNDFRGQILAGEDFSSADIRGTNFSGVVLVGANFRNAKAGLTIIWTVGLVVLSIILSLLAGLIAAYAGAFIGDLFAGKAPGHTLFGIISVITLITFLVIILWQGLGAIVAILAEVIAAFLIIVLAFLPETEGQVIDSLIIGTIFTVIALAGTLAGLVNMGLAVAVVRVMTLPGMQSVTGFMALFGIVLGALLGVRSHPSAYVVAGIVGLAAISLGSYVGWQAICDNKKYALIRALAVGIVSQGGTKFCGADLTDADFTQANLKSVDFRKAILTRTCWLNAEKLDQARIDSTYLKDVKVRKGSDFY
jgi:hypothetical protein